MSTQADQPPSMWGYWADKYGPVKALEDYYPNLLIINPALAMAVNMIKSQELMIDATMNAIADNESFSGVDRQAPA